MAVLTDEQVIERFNDPTEVRPEHQAIHRKFVDLARTISTSDLEPFHRNELLKMLLWTRNGYLRGIVPLERGETKPIGAPAARGEKRPYPPLRR